jgi:hypothetical protein
LSPKEWQRGKRGFSFCERCHITKNKTMPGKQSTKLVFYPEKLIYCINCAKNQPLVTVFARFSNVLQQMLQLTKFCFISTVFFLQRCGSGSWATKTDTLVTFL